MKKSFLLLIITVSTILSACISENKFEIIDDGLVLKYSKPANYWEEMLPLGNGRLGMMPSGGIDKEHIILNDITMWSGSEDDAVNPEAIIHLPQIRQLLIEGKNIDAQNLMYEYFRCKGQGSAFGRGKDAPYGCFQMLGNLDLNFRYPTNDTISDYEYGLKLYNATAYTQFKKGAVSYRREYYVSQSDDVILIRIVADKDNSINFNVGITRPERYQTSTDREKKTLQFGGQLNDGKEDTSGVKFYTEVKVLHSGGELSVLDEKLSLHNAKEAIIIVSSATNMLDSEYKSTVTKLLDKALNTGYEDLKARHIEAYQKQFNKVHLSLGKSSDKYTNERMYDFQKDKDPAFASLYFQYGRYLMISGTRENSMPLNLQGLWANSVETPWNGDYHLNINVQMNYWLAEVANLSEYHKPLLEFTKSLVNSGTETAQGFYNAKGWVAHVITNPWLFTAPAEHASWGATNTGGAWLCEHLWEHYAFTQNKNYLQSVYPTMEQAAQFFLTNMITEPKNGWLVTAPSSSPENAFYLPNSKDPVFVCMGPTMDVQIIKELFNNVLKASEILGINNETTMHIREALPKLPPMQISEKGYLQEWLEDYKEVEPHHRHVSHLYGLFPANQISPYRTPELADAARETLNRRGDEGTGWSRAWKINFWARLQDGDRSYKLLKNLLKPTMLPSGKMTRQGGTYPNLFCSHPPFQIDGNFGGAAGIAEMLIQSHNGFIEFLPALPSIWTSGDFNGFRVRGGAEVAAHWEENELQLFSIKATVNNTFKIKLPNYVKNVFINGKKVAPNDNFIELFIKAGEVAEVRVMSS